MDRLAALAAEAEAIGADFRGWRPWLSDAGEWWATRRGRGYRDPMTVYAGDTLGRQAAGPAELRGKLAALRDAEASRAACMVTAHHAPAGGTFPGASPAGHDGDGEVSGHAMR
jgi:hypothetical protein